MAKHRHLTEQSDFVKSFVSFQGCLNDNKASLTPEQTIRLFDIWLANTKDERFLEMQQSQIEPDEPWKRNSWGEDD